MATSEITVTVKISKRWFFWPCFYVCYAACRLGANPERAVEFLTKKCFDLEVIK